MLTCNPAKWTIDHVGSTEPFSQFYVSSSPFPLTLSKQTLLREISSIIYFQIRSNHFHSSIHDVQLAIAYMPATGVISYISSRFLVAWYKEICRGKQCFDCYLRENLSTILLPPELASSFTKIYLDIPILIAVYFDRLDSFLLELKKPPIKNAFLISINTMLLL